MPESQPVPPVVADGGLPTSASRAARPFMLADLNIDPPEADDDDCLPAATGAAAAPPRDPSPRNVIDGSNAVKIMATVKEPDVAECDDGDNQCQGVSTSREEKVSNLKNALVHVARKMPKNAHAQLVLGLMYQRLGQPQKAVSAFEKSLEILSQDEEEVRRPDLMSLVQIHHAQCVLQASMGDSFDAELEAGELDQIISKIKSSVRPDVKEAIVWNVLGLLLLRAGHLQGAIKVLSALLAVAPDSLDCLANLGIAYLQSGNMQLAAKCFQELVLKDQNHPAALINYGAFLLSRYGSNIAGPGAYNCKGPYTHQKEAICVAKDCLIVAAKNEPKAAIVWLNLAHAYYMAGEHKNSKRCLEQAARLEPNQIPARYAIAVHRVKDAERSQCSNEQLFWAANEMATVLRDGDSTMIDLSVAWAGLAMVHKAQHEIAAAFETAQMNMKEAEKRALSTLEQAINEDPEDVVNWNQLGLYNLSATQFSRSVNFLKAAVARSKDCNYVWSNLGVALQLSNDLSSAETIYKRAISLSPLQLSHPILSNLSILYRQQGRFELSRKILLKALELCPGYAPANNNLGLVYVAEGRWDDAISCFDKAVKADPLLDAARSNMMKAITCCSRQA